VKVSIDGITIGYDDVGSGENALVLVHGHPFDRSMWRPQVEKFLRQDVEPEEISRKGLPAMLRGTTHSVRGQSRIAMQAGAETPRLEKVSQDRYRSGS
jgi:3-oxoadipate enol-lactonase